MTEVTPPVEKQQSLEIGGWLLVSFIEIHIVFIFACKYIYDRYQNYNIYFMLALCILSFLMIFSIYFRKKTNHIILLISSFYYPTLGLISLFGGFLLTFGTGSASNLFLGFLGCVYSAYTWHYYLNSKEVKEFFAGTGSSVNEEQK